jgi:polyribonucleotide nucleotidyltransferase
MIDEIANPRPVLVGETYDGTVVKTTTFGAFVNLVPGRDGLVHISKLGKGKRLQSVEEAVKEGDRLSVRVEDIDPQGKISLRPIGPEWDVPEGAEESGGGGDRRPRGDGGSRGEGGGNRGGDRPRGRRFRDQKSGDRSGGGDRTG